MFFVKLITKKSYEDKIVFDLTFLINIFLAQDDTPSYIKAPNPEGLVIAKKVLYLFSPRKHS